MKEIGGYFGLDDLAGQEFHSDLVALNTGRHALWYVMKARNIEKLYIPYYLCDSVSNTLEKHGYDFDYYHVDENFMPIFERALGPEEYLYIVNFYGQLTAEKTRSLKQRHRRIIIDHIQAFFQKPVDGVDTIYSCRKYFGVPDGAYLATDVFLSEELEQDVSKDRVKHILGRYEGAASTYYNDFHAVDDVIDATPILKMSKLTGNLMRAIDYEMVRQTRNSNYAFLESRLAAENPLTLSAPDGAFAYPFLVEDGINLRKALAVRKIYIPLLWPNVIEQCPEESLEYQYAANILPLPCDQRYSVEDMEYMLDILEKHLITNSLTK